MKPGPGPLSGTCTREQCSFFHPSHLQVLSSLRCVLNTSKRTVSCLHLFLVWCQWGCCGFRHSSSRNSGSGTLGGGAGVLSITCLLSSWSSVPCSRHVPHMRTHSAVLSIRQARFLWWYVGVTLLLLLWNNLQWGRALCAERRFHCAKEKKYKSKVRACLVSSPW